MVTRHAFASHIYAYAYRYTFFSMQLFQYAVCVRVYVYVDILWCHINVCVRVCVCVCTFDVVSHVCVCMYVRMCFHVAVYLSSWFKSSVSLFFVVSRLKRHDSFVSHESPQNPIIRPDTRARAHTPHKNTTLKTQKNTHTHTRTHTLSLSHTHTHPIHTHTHVTRQIIGAKSNPCARVRTHTNTHTHTHTHTLSLSHTHYTPTHMPSGRCRMRELNPVRATTR